MLFCAVFGTVLFSATPIAHASDIGKRTMQDSRVPDTQPQKRVIMKEKRFVPRAQTEENASEQQDPANDGGAGPGEGQSNASESESNAGDNNNEIFVRPSSDDAESSSPQDSDESRDQSSDLQDEQNTQADEPSDEEIRERSRQVREDAENTKCAQVCKLSKQADCFERCRASGFCNLGFVNCGEDGSVSVTPPTE